MIKESVLAILDALEDEVKDGADSERVLRFIGNAKRLVNALEEK
jgi:hypothetical protein